MTTSNSEPLPTDSRSESSHTPGPWIAYAETIRVGAKPVANRLVVEAMDEDGPVGHIAFSEANARLIAAAPDLYATLNDVLDSFDRQTMEEMLRKDNDAHDDDEFCVNLTAKQLRAINQAILKAEGKP